MPPHGVTFYKKYRGFPLKTVRTLCCVKHNINRLLSKDSRETRAKILYYLFKVNTQKLNPKKHCIDLTKNINTQVAELGIQKPKMSVRVLVLGNVHIIYKSTGS